jgi:hypothetical protein
MQELDSSLFDWLTWRGGSLYDVFGIPCRTAALIQNRKILRKYAYGWTPGYRLMCRPKLNNTAIMFHKNGRDFWFHLRTHEFEAIWPEQATKYYNRASY